MKIESEIQYNSALKRYDELFNKKLSKEEKSEFENLTGAIQNYENTHYKVIPPHPIEAIKFRMSAQNLKEEDLIPYFGNLKTVKEVLAGRRKLDLSMIRGLHKGLGIPAEVLVQEY